MAIIEPSSFTTKRGAAGRIRCVEWTDAERLIRHRLHIEETASEFGVGPPEPASLLIADQVRKIEDRRAHPDELFLVADVGGRFAGVVLFHANQRDRMRHHGHFGISVDQEYRGEGVGRALISELLKWATAHPLIEKVCLGVFAHNHRAIGLYRAMGFKEEGRREGEFKFNHGVYVDDIQMSLWVKPRGR